MTLTKMAIGVIGIHTAMDGREVPFTQEMFEDVQASYSQELSEAPIVIGHPSLTAPAYGWVKEVSVEDGVLYAHVGQVDAAFAEAVNSGRYKKRSASFFLPQTPGNPKPGHFYLRHVGFLGAALPSVKGLGDVSFAECNDKTTACIDFAFDEGAINPKNKEENPMDKTKEQLDAEAKAAEAAKQREADLAAREKALKEREDKVAEAEKARQAEIAQAQQKDAADFAEELVKAGKVLPAQKNALIEVLVANANQPISFSDGSQTVSKPSLDVLKEILSQKPIDFAEKSGEADQGGRLDTQDPTAIAKSAAEYQAEQAQKGNTISMTDAVSHVMNGATK